jgi:hypothetical protein
MNEIPTAQYLLNIAFSLAGLLGGWVMKFFYDQLHDLAVQDQRLAEKVQAIEILVAGEYVKRDQLERLQEALFSKLDRIESKLDGKVDK